MEQNQYPRDTVVIALCIYECMLENVVDTSNSIIPDRHNPWTQMSLRWENVGAYEMREIAIHLAEWMVKVVDELDKMLGNDSLEKIDLSPFDWEFVPRALKDVDWVPVSAVRYPEPVEYAHRLIGLHALGVDA